MDNPSISKTPNFNKTIKLKARTITINLLLLFVIFTYLLKYPPVKKRHVNHHTDVPSLNEEANDKPGRKDVTEDNRINSKPNNIKCFFLVKVLDKMDIKGSNAISVKYRVMNQ
jgi:hypothetical protein